VPPEGEDPRLTSDAENCSAHPAATLPTRQTPHRLDWTRCQDLLLSQAADNAASLANRRTWNSSCLNR
jgi:hypothetical protein